MALPTDTDYSDAIQNPQLAFEDPELRGGQVENFSLQNPQPKPRSGNFAVAFRMDCGPKSYAVKCFTRDVPDLHARYTEISKHLAATRLVQRVGFEFLLRGIKVGWVRIFSTGSRVNDFAKLIAPDLSGSITSA